MATRGESCAATKSMQSIGGSFLAPSKGGAPAFGGATVLVGPRLPLAT